MVAAKKSQLFQTSRRSVYFVTWWPQWPSIILETHITVGSPCSAGISLLLLAILIDPIRFYEDGLAVEAAIDRLASWTTGQADVGRSTGGGSGGGGGGGGGTTLSPRLMPAEVNWLRGNFLWETFDTVYIIMLEIAFSFALQGCSYLVRALSHNHLEGNTNQNETTMCFISLGRNRDRWWENRCVAHSNICEENMLD